ncbi:uncharacterized protein PHALS_04625 [Plasmopara halstedii]|uniref:Uncharacterized protein n=1 Tax=Plasmopara halstedii TaxID=4781 RepID=A0A0P1A8Y2_PLAHL|nr:uncharacterized protein PHALS_04625 [Plasmopara halstedii]CEG37178.1 hypothetical protein PHALS_04625 [Plasmopara halstedii]|eukprot:XP_024573547.1 hypothetical protein PHALS_04625 [Plasmopara halstedii]
MNHVCNLSGENKAIGGPRDESRYRSPEGVHQSLKYVGDRVSWTPQPGEGTGNQIEAAVKSVMLSGKVSVCRCSDILNRRSQANIIRVQAYFVHQIFYPPLMSSEN